MTEIKKILVVIHRYHSLTLTKMRRLLFIVTATTCSIGVCWTTLTFFGDSTKLWKDKALNETVTVEIPRLMIKSWYPWNSYTGMGYYLSFAFQFYYLLFSMLQANLSDVLFCSWVLFCCEQLQHLKVNNEKVFPLSWLISKKIAFFLFSSISSVCV